MNIPETANHKQPRVRRLYLSAIDFDYREEYDLVMGPWCFMDSENKNSNWEDHSFLQAFDTKEKLVQAPEDCFNLTAYLIVKWGERLNEKHGTDYDSNFWWPLLARWIYPVTCAVWRRWELTNRFIEIYQEDSLEIPLISFADQISWTFADNTELVEGLMTPEFDFWLNSLCLKKQAPPRWILEPVPDFNVPTLSEKNDPQHTGKTNSLKKLGRKILGRLPFGDVHGIGPIWTLIFAAWVGFLQKRSQARYYFPEAKKPPSNFPAAYLGLLDIVLTKTIPKYLNADFHKFNEDAKRYKYKLGHIFVNSSSAGNTRVNFQVAHAITNGEVVIRSQHGSSYGTMANEYCSQLTEYAMSAFLTWGWKAQDSSKGRFLATPSPALSRIRNHHRPRNKDIILVGTKTWVRSHRVDYTPDPSYTLVYRKEKIKFISALNESLQENFLYRPYTRSKVELEDGAYVSRHFPDIKILDGSLEKAILNCRLLVLDHPGTTLNVAMAANVPLICFWNQELWPYSKEATPYFEAMKKAGMIFNDGESAARRINDISKNVQGWWTSDEVQSARLAWADQFANTARFWWWHWFQTLNRI